MVLANSELAVVIGWIITIIIIIILIIMLLLLAIINFGTETGKLDSTYSMNLF